MDHRESFSLSMVTISPHFCQATVTVPHAIAARIYHLAAVAQQAEVNTQGFSKGAIPLEYITHNYQASIEAHVKEFLLNYAVINFLLKKLQEHKVIIIGEPRLINISSSHDHNVLFDFECTVPTTHTVSLWKHLPFKAPGRKHYRDIDRQVESFIQEEEQLQSSYVYPLSVTAGDLICFSVSLVDHQHEPLLGDHAETLWLKIGAEEGDSQFQELFIGKHVGDIFYSRSKCLQEYFSTKLEDYATFAIHVRDIVPHHFFCLTAFKDHFQIKTEKDVRRKLIEVFSYRNDLSQRRLMAEGAISLLLRHNQITIPHHAVLRHEQDILTELSQNPDYPVYKMERDFSYRVEQLAIKQLKESLLIDSIAYNENLTLSAKDTANYLNLTKRARTKEFVYFIAPYLKIHGQELPISEQLLNQYALREKTLNHVIRHLTKQ